MNDTLINILAAIFYIAEKQGEPLCYNAETRQICRIIDDSCGVFSLLPAGATEESPTLHFSAASIITHRDLVERSAKIGLLSAHNGLTTGEHRIQNNGETETATDLQRIENSHTTGCEQENNGRETEEKRRVIGFGTVNLPRVSVLYSGEQAKVLAQIEAALDKIFNNTNKEATIKKYIAKYDNIQRMAAAGSLYELKLALNSLLGTIEKQKAMQRGVEKMERKATLKKRAVNALIIFVFAVAALFWLRPWNWGQSDGCTVAASPTAPAIGANLSPFDLAIREFETETGKKIYPGGRACLQSAAARLGLTTKKQIKELIKQNVK